MTAWATGADVADDEVLDLRAVVGDDSLIEALSANLPGPDDNALAVMLAAWRDDCRDAADPTRARVAASKQASMRAGVRAYLLRMGLDPLLPEGSA
jgi:hypothetical protein